MNNKLLNIQHLITLKDGAVLIIKRNPELSYSKFLNELYLASINYFQDQLITEEFDLDIYIQFSDEFTNTAGILRELHFINLNNFYNSLKHGRHDSDYPNSTDYVIFCQFKLYKIPSLTINKNFSPFVQISSIA